MARALGIGGVFFKSNDPEKLAGWYARWLGFEIDSTFNGSIFRPANLPDGAYGVWSPFPASTEYFQPSTQPFMINLIVDDVDGALAQVAQGGATLAGEPQEDQFGRFGWFMDPDGNKVELWEPAS